MQQVNLGPRHNLNAILYTGENRGDQYVTAPTRRNHNELLGATLYREYPQMKGHPPVERLHHLQGPKVLERRSFTDNRGLFRRLFEHSSDLANDSAQVLQINVSHTLEEGTVRGLHLQFGQVPEAKIVSCLSGAVFDVIVDLRPGSRTFGRWYGLKLSSESLDSLYIPPGFAHGLQCLAENSIVHYVHTAQYEPHSEFGIFPLDPEIGILWPLPPVNISERDSNLPNLSASGLQR